MPKSAKKSASKAAVSTPASVEQKTKPTKNGKRDAEEIVEKKVVSGKKQKTVNGGAPRAIEKQTKAQKKKNKKQETSSSESEGEEEEEQKEEPKNDAVAAENENESESDDGDSSDEEDAVEPASKAEEGSDDDNDEGSEEEDDSSEDEDEPKAAKKTVAPATPAAGSKTLFVGNLSYSVKEDDLADFFKDAGEVVEVRLAMRDGRFSGYGHVEFATPDAAQKALERNGEELLERAVRLDIAKEKGAYTSNDGSSQKGGQSQALTVFVKGFGTDDGYDDVKSSLEEHFGKCGEISRISIPKDFESGDLKGVAFIDFPDRNALSKAIGLSGSEVSGGTIVVEEAKQRGGGGGSGRGRGGRGGGRGDRFGGGRGGGRGDRFGGGRGGGRGRGGGGGRGRGRGRR